jgi:hypothetical protein
MWQEIHPLGKGKGHATGREPQPLAAQESSYVTRSALCILFHAAGPQDLTTCKDTAIQHASSTLTALIYLMVLFDQQHLTPGGGLA